MSNKELYSEIIEALLAARESTDAKQAYRRLRFVLTRLVDVAMRSVPLQFAGLFAKINHLLAERKASVELTRAVNDTRNRIRRLERTQESDLQKTLLYDIKTLSGFMLLLFPEAEIPAPLLQNLPSGTLKSTWGKIDSRYLRVMVVAFTESEITVRAELGDDIEITVVYGSANEYLKTDHSYLMPLLSEGAQLNLIHPRSDGGKLYPEQIIYEPDFLVDISSIASLFREHGVTPLTALINKLSPKAHTRATLLGEFASQLLDETLHGNADRTYAESIKEFCKHHSVAMATCEGLDASFHTDAQAQKAHIKKAFNVDLPQSVDNFQPSEAVLEPSFSCEMLGLQGRMDYLQRDFQLLIEQKSGKAGFVPGEQGFINPHLTQPHYVQVLLYRALLHYNFDLKNEQIRPFLLYSKYEHPLLGTDSAPALLAQAFALRNQMVYAELHYANKGFGLLKTLKADDLNTVGTHSKLWTQFVAPQIESVLSPLRTAESIELKYHQAMLRFVQREFVLGKIGNKRKENSGFAARWHDSLEQKKEAGNIVDGMDVEATTTHIVCHNADLGSSNFRIGDIVTIYPYIIGTEPDCRKTIIHRAVIEEIGADTITLRLRVPQNNTALFATKPNQKWAMEHDMMDSAYAGELRAVHSFLSASEQRRSLLMMKRKPHVDESETLSGDYHDFNELQLRVKQAQELFLIIGPPGTGKTSFGMLYSLQEELTRHDGSVAAMAFTNRAVDEICSKLVEQDIDFVRIGSELSCSAEYRPYLLSNKVAEIKKISDIREFIKRQKVIVGTTTAFNSHSAIFTLRGFSLAIVDEASQLLEPQLIGLLSAKHGDGNAIKKFLLIGDHKQLPAVVSQQPQETVIDDPELRAIGLTDTRNSLFERLLSHYKNDPSVVYMLRKQGRMHEQIAAFPNKFFYENQLECVPLKHQQEPSTEARVQFIDVENTVETVIDKVNVAEAKAIANIVKGLESGVSIGIIVPYRNQISAIRHALHSTGVEQADSITIDTVERFQGSQREVIIYGFTVQRPYQLDFLTDNCFFENDTVIDRKLNVVMTRAMKRLFLVGNAKLLSRNALFRELIMPVVQK